MTDTPEDDGSTAVCVLRSMDGRKVLVLANSGAAAVRPDLGANAERAQETEGAARDGGISHVQVDRDLAAALQVLAPRRVKEPRELCKPVTRAPRRDRRKLVA